MAKAARPQMMGELLNSRLYAPKAGCRFCVSKVPRIGAEWFNHTNGHLFHFRHHVMAGPDAGYHDCEIQTP